MDKHKNKQNSLIDKFYNEENSRAESVSNKELEDFKACMDLLSDNMDILNEYEPQIDISIMDIIVKAEGIKNRRKAIAENIIFIILGLLILGSMSVLSLLVGIKFIIIFEAIAFVLFPFALIPISKAVICSRRYE